MGRGKIIVIEGTDCSGKETQTRMLAERFEKMKIPCGFLSFPIYDSPTGRIVGGPYLGKPEICESWFPEGASLVDPKISCLYYAADRRAALPKIESLLSSGHLILDRYVSSNMAHQGGKIEDKNSRKEFYQALDYLEYNFLGLPRPDVTIFLYMPYEVGMVLGKGRKGKADGHESSPEHLRNAEEAYLQLADMYSWKRVNCTLDGTMNTLKSRKEIHEEVCQLITEETGDLSLMHSTNNPR